ncbi:methylated-DNA--[protein]-cysteine S-methyltransferase [soil metagenome]
MKNLASTTHQTPVGPFTVIVDDDVVLASGWTADVNRLLPYVHTAVRREFADEVRGYDELGQVSKAVLAFHDGDLTAPDAIPVRQAGSELLSAAWKQLRTVPAGTTVSYRELATLSGKPMAVRAAASACARNATALFVPCHRVVRTDGSLGGFGYGLDVKRWLLRHESPES